MTVVRAAAVQISPVLYSREATVEKVVRKIHELGQQRVQFATFPETVVPYYPYFSFVQSPVQNIAGPEQRKLIDQAVTVPSHATDAIGDAARHAGVVVSIGVNERDGGVHLSYDAMASLIAPYGSQAALAVAGDLDAKIERLLETASGGQTEDAEAPNGVGQPG